MGLDNFWVKTAPAPFGIDPVIGIADALEELDPLKVLVATAEEDYEGLSMEEFEDLKRMFRAHAEAEHELTSWY